MSHLNQRDGKKEGQRTKVQAYKKENISLSLACVYAFMAAAAHAHALPLLTSAFVALYAWIDAYVGLIGHSQSNPPKRKGVPRISSHL